ncbi:uncharacterized protein LOC125760465 [Anopheles funestus]|uniref:uncharacterized protein LOC125760465 n=1 Tax=Anopheles funestus TaxID=62324 RepID=UPI0020C5CC68|nr:uncharacterized protein LOC125760465 [Anopheles funestus]XP_049276583.1 uncharacterized protein LOC125760465 [Anopheles funestus]XP_049276584.1 uncharacterized protein LOC125760465 [Anopheles funestus]
MDVRSATLERATELIKCCKVPRLLDANIEEAPLERATFEHFLHVLDGTLPTVFDLLAEHGPLLTGYDAYNEDDNVEFKAGLALVIAEQYSTAQTSDGGEDRGHGEVYRTSKASLRKRIAQYYEGHELEHLLTDKGSDRVWHRLYEHYRLVLSATEWKYHPADAAGFVQLVELLYGPYTLHVASPPELNDDAAAYILSVGITLVEFFEPAYRLMGVRLFCMLLGSRHRPCMRRTNIHRVVYSNAKKLVLKCNQEHFLEALWKCFYLYVELEEADRKDFTAWSTVDDIMEMLLNGLTFQTKLDMASIYLLYLVKLLALDLPNYIIDGLDEIQSIDRKCQLYEPVCEQLRQDCLDGFHNRRYYRWLHQIIQLLPHEAVKCQGTSREQGRYCHGVNLLFILVTFPVEPEALRPTHLGMQTNLVEFINVFKQYEQQQSALAAKRSSATSDFVYNTKALVSVSKTMLVFLTTLAPHYFPDHPAMASLGQKLADDYADCDSIMYNCMQSLIEKLR